jgi:hypothetical protein
MAKCPVTLSRLEVLKLSGNRLTDAAGRNLAAILAQSKGTRFSYCMQLLFFMLFLASGIVQAPTSSSLFLLYAIGLIYILLCIFELVFMVWQLWQRWRLRDVDLLHAQYSRLAVLCTQSPHL